MTYNDVLNVIREINLPFAYDHFAEGESPGPPFIIFQLPGTDNFMADGTVYVNITELAIELYTDRKQPQTEALVELVLDANGLPWEKTEVWIPEEQMYEVRYNTQVMLEKPASTYSRTLKK